VSASCHTRDKGRREIGQREKRLETIDSRARDYRARAVGQVISWPNSIISFS